MRDKPDPATETWRRYLLVLPHLPFPADNGAQQRSLLIVRALAAIADVDLLISGRPSHRESSIGGAALEVRSVSYAYDQGSSRFSSPIFRIPGVRAIASTLKRYGRDVSLAERLLDIVESTQPNLIVFRYAQTASRAGAERFRHYVIDADDHDLRVIMSEMRTTRNPARIALKAIQLAMTAVPWHRIAAPAQAITFAFRR